ncbi:MAG: hypothetical protein NVSMB2_13680 [Chloroflexota bacterium]
MTHTQTQARFGFALEYVSDIEATKRFFVDVLGLDVERDHPSFVQFTTRNGASYAIASDEPMVTGGSPELWWVVDDVGAAFEDIAPRAEITMPVRHMPFGRCFGVRDPAGQVHHLVELPAQRPSVQIS